MILYVTYSLTTAPEEFNVSCYRLLYYKSDALFNWNKIISQIYQLFSHYDSRTAFPTNKSDLKNKRNWKSVCIDIFLFSCNAKNQHISSHKRYIMSFGNTNTDQSVCWKRCGLEQFWFWELGPAPQSPSVLILVTPSNFYLNSFKKKTLSLNWKDRTKWSINHFLSLWDFHTDLE